MVSVILCTYNRDVFLSKTIESVLNQSYSDFELIIIDDGSTDRSPATIKDLSDPRIRVKKNNANIGIVGSRNIALKMARGDLIAIIDSDDLWELDKLENQVKKFDNDSLLIGVGSYAYIINSQGRINEVRSFPIEHHEIHSTFLWRCPFIHSSFMFRNIGLLYNSSLSQAEDLDLFIRLSKLGKLENINRPLIHYRVHRDSLTSLKSQQQSKDGLAVRLSLLSEVANINLEIYEMMFNHKLDSLSNRQEEVNLFVLQLSRTNLMDRHIIRVHTWILKTAVKTFKIRPQTIITNIKLRIRMCHFPNYKEVSHKSL
jgi:glycosyltransferase involved in cell wall biosynthesis